MDLTVLDKNFISLKTVDTYKSLIWTERYYGYGDFEIYIPFSYIETLGIFQMGYYLINDKFDSAMIIDKIETATDAETGNMLVISGKSLESVLLRRSIYNQTNINGNFQTGIKKLMDENIISPSDSLRKIPNIIFESSTDTAITSLKNVDAQFTGDALYSAIEKLCTDREVGFKMTLNDNNQFVFKLYAGANRSYAQDSNPYVVFSPSYDNLLSSDYKEDASNFGNYVIVAGEGEGAARKKVYKSYSRLPNGGTISGTPSGMDRYEIFIDARDISSNIDGGTLTDAEYKAKLTERGDTKMAEYDTIKEFQSNVTTATMYKYGKDFNMGDIVQIETEFGMERSARVTEYIYSDSDNGVEEYPTFTF